MIYFLIPPIRACKTVEADKDHSNVPGGINLEAKGMYPSILALATFFAPAIGHGEQPSAKHNAVYEWAELFDGKTLDGWFKPNYGKAAGGQIGLQNYGPGVWFRNIKIRPLEAR